MNKRRELIIPAVIAGILLLALAVVYWVDSAGSLPSFLPGHEAGSSHHHVKHGIAAAILAAGAFAVAWFQTGAQRPEPPDEHPMGTRAL
jgi:hypothetical protein